MIVTKSSLSAVKVAKRDKDLPILGNVRFEPDGTTIACARNIVIAVSPPNPDKAKQAPVDDTGPLDAAITVPAEDVKTVLRELPTDKQFDGLLEFVDVHKLGTGHATFMWTYDGQGQALRTDLHEGHFIKYRDIFKRSLRSRRGVRIKMNRVRLKALCDALDKVAPDNGEAPVYIEFTETGDMIMRATNPVTGQRAVAVMTAYKERGQGWLDPDEWERGLTDDVVNGDAHNRSRVDSRGRFRRSRNRTVLHGRHEGRQTGTRRRTAPRQVAPTVKPIARRERRR